MTGVEPVARLRELTRLVLEGLITTSEAIARVRTDANLLAGVNVIELAELGWQAASTERVVGCLMTGLVHEWTVTHVGPNSAAVFASGRAFARAATEVLLAHDDSDVYRRAHRAADRMIDAAAPADLAAAHYLAGRLHLAPYALDPAHGHHEYALGRELRSLREEWSLPRSRMEEELMPEPAIGLDRAVRHLAAAAAGLTGEARGEVLAHLAFAEFSRQLAGAGGADRLSNVDGWCAESLTLLPPRGEPLACGRLLWILVLRGRFGPVLDRPIPVPRLDPRYDPRLVMIPDGLVQTVVVGVTAVRLLCELGRADETREIADTVWPLAVEDPDLQTQLLYLDLAITHNLPGDPFGCRARRLGPVDERGISGAALTASRIHGLVCDPETGNAEADLAAVDAAQDAIHRVATRESRQLAIVSAYRIWQTAVRALDQHDELAIYWLSHAVSLLIQTRNNHLAMLALAKLQDAIHGVSAEEFAEFDMELVGPALVYLVIASFLALSEAGCRAAMHCVSMLMGRWSLLEATPGPEQIPSAIRVALFMILVKGRALAGALARPGPIAPDPMIARVADLAAEPGEASNDRWSSYLRTWVIRDDEEIIGTFLHSAERESGASATERSANLKRSAQARDNARLAARVTAGPTRLPHDVQQAIPDGAVLLNLLFGVHGTTSLPGFHVTVSDRDTMVALPVVEPDTTPDSRTRTTTMWSDSENTGFASTRIVHSWWGPWVARIRRELLAEPLHRDVTRAGEQALAEFAGQFPGQILDRLAVLADAGNTRLIFWPNESLYFLPLHLIPFRDGILADYFTVTILPSVECLFREPLAATVAPAALAIACAAGGRSVGLPDEPSLHGQAERIAGLFGTRPLIGNDATPAAALDLLGSSRYLHLAAHGTQDVHAPIYARLYLAGGALHAYQILESDLRGTELVTLSACESALLRYDFLDNLHGLVPAFLRAGARAVVGALWPVSPEVAETFFTELYAHLARGGTPVDAFRHAQHQARASHSNYRDWGAFSYFGS